MPISDSFILSNSHVVPFSPRPGTFVESIFVDFDTFPAEKTAIVDYASGHRYTFADLKRLTEQVASGLVKRGLGKGHVLSLFGSNVIENAPIAFGAAVTGATVHLVKPVATQEELRFHFNLVTPKIIVTTANCAEGVLEAVKAIGLDVQDIFVIGGVVNGCRRAEELLEDRGDANPWGQVEINDEEDIALLLQTGGTTGMSKTVELTHKAIKLGLLEVQDFLLSPVDEEMSLGNMPFNHIYCFSLIYGSWLRLGCGVVNLTSNDPEILFRAIEKYKVTRIGVTPATLVSLQSDSYFEKAKFDNLREMIVSGAAVSTEKLFPVMKSKCPNVWISQAYGATELSGVVTLHPLSDVSRKKKVSSVGVAVPSAELKVLNCDEQRRPCKPNESGELLIRSSRIMKGYLKNEDATRKTVVDGWYLTGDYSYFDEDGYVYIMDRVADLIRCGGKMIVPTHVEGILRGHPGIKDCAVVGHVSKEDGATVMTAFVVRKDCDVKEVDVQRYAAKNLQPHEQLTGGICFVSNLPKSPAGKILRRLLIQNI